MWKKLFSRFRKDKSQETEEQVEVEELQEVEEEIVPEIEELQAEVMEVSLEEEQEAERVEAVKESFSFAEDLPAKVEVVEAPKPKVNFFGRLKEGLKKTRNNLVDKIEQLVKNRTIDASLFEELEDLLIQADVGFDTTMLLIAKLKARVKEERLTEGHELHTALKKEISYALSEHHAPLKFDDHRPNVIMVVGVNGAGKTTTIGKLAYRMKNEGAKVVLGAGDTFRAAAIDQLGIWADRVGVEMISQKEGSDPAAVAFDALAAARARKADVLIMDTAGRLQTKTNLMAELGKVQRVLRRELGREVDEILLVLDATTGQNAISQAKIFGEAVPITGVVLTKLDGTAKGGIVLAINQELKIPVKLIGVGETYHDLQDFDPKRFAEALFG